MTTTQTETEAETEVMAAAAQKILKNGVAPARAVSRLVSQHEPSLSELATLTTRRASNDEFPLAASIQKNVPIYKLPSLSSLDATGRSALQDEWYRVLLSGPGVFVTKGLFKDTSILDRSTEAYYRIIEHERQTATSQGDHFAAAGKNDRIWNSFSKHALRDPASFIDYYSNPYLGLIASAWLGPWYRITAQANNVKPGSAAQVSHRDYHLGFQTEETCARIPRSMHVASQFLTLQGAVAHVDVPLESGPTRLLPYSQTMESGYMAYRQQEFVDYFLENYIALPMEKGDGIFFNPALFHAAGENVSQDINRMANLVQISSAFGKSMETVDALPILEKCWDEIAAKYKKEGMSEEVDALLAAITSPYPFPTNMDNNPPRPGGLTPVGELDVAIKGLTEGWSKDKLVGEFKKLKENSLP